MSELMLQYKYIDQLTIIFAVVLHSNDVLTNLRKIEQTSTTLHNHPGDM